MNKKFILSASVISLVLPNLVFGQPGVWGGGGIIALLSSVVGVVLQATWVIATAFAVVMFVIAGFKFFTAQGEPGKVAEARQAVIWGVAGVVVVLLAWSIIAIMSATLGV